MTQPLPEPSKPPAVSGTPPPARYVEPIARTNVLATVSIVLAFVIPPAAIVTGHIALIQIKRSGESGRGLALAGTICGYVMSVLSVVAVVAYFLLLALLYGMM